MTNPCPAPYSLNSTTNSTWEIISHTVQSDTSCVDISYTTDNIIIILSCSTYIDSSKLVKK